jgi:protein O-GlcNAc transferase
MPHDIRMSGQSEALRLYDSGRFAEAEAAFRLATEREPRAAAAWSGLGHAAAARLEHGTAVGALRRAVALGADDPALRVNLARSLFALGRASEAMAENERALREGDATVRAKARTNAAIMAPGDPSLDNAGILAARRRWAEAAAEGIRPLGARPGRGKKIRLGYYGSFFDSRNWMKMYMGVLNAHDRDRFEVNIIVDGAVPSAAAGYRDHPDDRIWEVTGITNAELAGHVAEAGLDVLVDMLGTSHMARLALPLHRAAPVHVAWNGMFGTTGMPLDALVGDRRVITAAEEAFCTETVRLASQTYLPFEMFYPTPPVAPPPCLVRGHVTFGSLGSAYKLTPLTIATWSAVLRACPSARLLLRNRALDHASNRADLLGRFAAEGIAAERLTLLGGAPHDAFLAAYAEIDISLDTFPYNGGTTTAEALWQGVPVLTTNGDRWAGRTSRTLLMAAGFGEDVSEDAPGLVQRASALASAPAALAARRAGQRQAVAASPACDPVALCRELEALYAELADRA